MTLFVTCDGALKLIRCLSHTPTTHFTTLVFYVSYVTFGYDLLRLPRARNDFVHVPVSCEDSCPPIASCVCVCVFRHSPGAVWFSRLISICSVFHGWELLVSSSHRLASCWVHAGLFLSAVSGLGNLPSSVQTVIARETAAIFTDKDTRSLNADFLCDNSHSLEHVLAGKFVPWI